MLPNLLLPENSGTPVPLLGRAPRNFRAAKGVRSAWSVGAGPFGRTPLSSRSRLTAAQKAGLRFERKVQDGLGELFGSPFRPGQWFRFEDESSRSPRWCQVDGLLQLQTSVVIFEVKSRLVVDAWWQLRRLYEPVVRRAFYPAEVALCVIARNVDPLVRFPEEYEFLPNVAELASFRPGFFVSSWSK